MIICCFESPPWSACLDAGHSTKLDFGRMLCGPSGDSIHQMLSQDAITSFGLLMLTAIDRLHEFCFHSLQGNQLHIGKRGGMKKGFAVLLTCNNGCCWARVLAGKSTQFTCIGFWA